MSESILVIGGCRSGKSNHALELAEKLPGDNKIYIATCIPHDDEMQDRVKRHQAERGPHWHTLEVPVNLPEAIVKHGTQADVLLIDCLTLWVSNLLLENDDIDSILSDAVQPLTAALQSIKIPVLIVSNEVGAGIVPENRLARLFRDIAGHTNKAVAAACDRVIWMVAGIPVNVKG
ncbi:MAG: bifunctional adenosylcobinamide kinase/adenosylcobinamide-phosphate guanylyltransferase [Deltaproteobacteria bacterium]|nr:bifunctional adenosylcobinamide kinase/adenosylcobinamide-phosphate guanylyltransferase [Deltaproteobacteria bacterium]